MSVDALPSPRTTRQLLFDRDFGLIAWGKFGSSIGLWIHAVVSAVVVYQASGSAFMVGLVSVAQFGVQIIGTPLSGKAADRGGVRNQLLLGRALCVAGSAVVGLWLLFMDLDGWGTTTVVLIGSLSTGLGFVLSGPALQALIPKLVTPDEMSSAMALNTAPLTVARLLGPAVGALVVAHVNAVAGYALATLGQLTFLLALSFVRMPAVERPSKKVDYSVRAGLAHVRSDRPLLLLLLAGTAVGLGSEPTVTLAPALTDNLGGGTELVGWLGSAFGLGAMVGLLMLTLLNKRVANDVFVSVGLGMLAGGLALSAVVNWSPLALLGFALNGCGFGLALTSIGTGIQLRVPASLRGRIMALWFMGWLGSRPFAAIAVGVIADVASVRAALLAGLVAPLLAFVACRPSRLRVAAPQ